jgi:AcrR family transcriptional regulator
MASEAKRRIVEGAAELLAKQGVQATSFAEVLKRTGGSRGSIYHHFPRGKSQLVEEAVDLLSEQAFAPMESYAGRPADQVTAAFLQLWRSFTDGYELRGGCAILTVTVTADSPRLIECTGAVFRSWRVRLAALLAQGGLTQPNADAFSATLIAAVEGALVISRAERSMEPFDLVASQLLSQARHLAAS